MSANSYVTPWVASEPPDAPQSRVTAARRLLADMFWYREFRSKYIEEYQKGDVAGKGKTGRAAGKEMRYTG